jgi:hypothetical protein
MEVPSMERTDTGGILGTLNISNALSPQRFQNMEVPSIDKILNVPSVPNISNALSPQRFRDIQVPSMERTDTGGILGTLNMPNLQKFQNMEVPFNKETRTITNETISQVQPQISGSQSVGALNISAGQVNIQTG